MTSAQRPMHLTGTILVGPDWELDEIWIADGVIHTSAPESAGEFEKISGVVVPGLVDVHSHIGIGADGPTSVERAEEQAILDRNVGTLLIRDAGSAIDNSWVQEREDLPRLVRAGQHIARPKRYIRNFARELEDVNDLPEVVAQEARRGDGWVKLVGDWIDRSLGADADLTPLWPVDVLTDAVAAAHENGARMTIHAFARETIDDVLAAGVDGVEHGTGMSDDHMAEFAARGIHVTVTALQTELFKDFVGQAGAKYPVYAARMLAMYEGRTDFWGRMVDADVPLLMGSDAGSTLDQGTLPRELAACVELGIPAERVLAAATWAGREYLGADGVEDGASADVVVYETDPRADITVTRAPRAVILRGTRVV
ncbi:MAG: amidohydrolase family protein [Actinomycetaceae bacterium]